MRILALALSLVGPFAWATPDPYIVAGKIQSDLDTALSRMVPSEQFLVQVNSDIAMRTERKLLEGETLVSTPESRPRPIPAMPGFVPEPQVEESKPPSPPTKQTYRMVEIPELRSVRVSVSFDDALTPQIVARAKTFVSGYLQSNFPGRAALAFQSVPMLKPVKETNRQPQSLPEEGEKKKKDEKPPSESDILWNYARWAVVALLLMMIFMQAQARKPITEGGARPSVTDPVSLISQAARAAVNAVGAGSSANHSPPAASRASVRNSDPEVSERRKRLLERFLSRSQAFKQYFEQMGAEPKRELYGSLKGPAFDQLLDGLKLPRPDGATEPSNVDECLASHEKDFDEFIHAKDWQERQFFGFMQHMSDEQLAKLVTQVKPSAACILLRFMKPNQSAYILDLLPQLRRREVLQHMSNVHNVPLSELLAAEKEARGISQQMPDRFGSSEKDEVDFWGNVVAESQDSDTLMEDLETTHPGISPRLAKYRFRLEDVATLPDSLLERILGNVDNDELCLALATCQADVVDVILEGVSPKRREVLKAQLSSSRSAPKTQAMGARLNLTRKIREAMT